MQEVITWASTIAALIGFGFAMGTNPALYAATADMLARGIRLLPRLLWMVGGLFLGATILYVLFQTFNPTSFVTLLRGRLNAVLLNRTFDLILGIVFLVAAFALIMWKLRVRTLPKHPKKQAKKKVSNSGLSGYFVIGLSSAFIGFTTLPIMYLTGQVISSLSSQWPPRLIAYAVFLLALGAPFFLLAYLWSRFPKLTSRITELYARAQQWDYRLLSALILVVAGITAILLAVLQHR